MTDEIGMLAHVDNATRRETLGLVREGRLYDLGRVLDESVPVFPGTQQLGTHIDALSHLQATLATDGVREFALILTHPKLRGATSAWTSPIALV